MNSANCFERLRNRLNSRGTETGEIESPRVIYIGDVMDFDAYLATRTGLIPELMLHALEEAEAKRIEKAAQKAMTEQMQKYLN